MWVHCKRFQPSTKREAFLLKKRTSLAKENTKTSRLCRHAITSLRAACPERDLATLQFVAEGIFLPHIVGFTKLIVLL